MSTGVKRVAVVTGASRGIGKAIALRLAKDGRHVVLMARSEGPLGDLKAQIEAAGGAATAKACDISDPKAFAAALESVATELGRLDILVNNAGITKDGLILRMSDEDWSSVLQTNLTSAFVAARTAGRLMMKNRFGRIVNIGSTSGVVGNAGQANYAAAKAGIASMTIVLARELRKYGVTVNAIAPRARTRMTQTVLGDLAPEEGQFDEWDPANIAPVVAWLASDLAAGVSGQVFVVAGDKVHLMAGWDRVGRIDHDGSAWTVDDLAAAAGDLFGERGSKLPKMGFGE